MKTNKRNRIPAKFSLIHWFVIDALRQKKITPADLAVYSVLSAHTNKQDHSCWPSQVTVSNILGCSRKTVVDAYKRLADAGLIKINSRGATPKKKEPRLVRLLFPQETTPVTAETPEAAAMTPATPEAAAMTAEATKPILPVWDGTLQSDPEPCSWNEHLAWEKRKEARVLAKLAGEQMSRKVA